jgi:hypothetical protein
MYPDAPKPMYQDRRSSTAEQRYRELGIAREDGSARGRAVAANWDCFGATAALFCYIDRDMGSPQRADLGMSIGFEDADDAARHARTGRAPLDETVTFIG